jgi:hypothetical protein
MKFILSGQFCFLEAPWLSWEDLRYGLNKGFLDTRGVVEYAIGTLSNTSVPAHFELTCLAVDDDFAIYECLDRLAGEADQDAVYLQRVWLFLCLLWIFRNKDAYEDPLGVVEELYSDFDYPEIMAPAVRYMPTSDSSPGSEARLYVKWQETLDILRAEVRQDRVKR